MKGHEHFVGELSALINRYSGESDSNTPDWLLANYMADCLEAYNRAVTARDKWYGSFTLVTGEPSVS